MPEVQPFDEWLRDLARKRGYKIDGARSGGRSELADDAGVSRGQVGRALNGETTPDLRSQRGLAKALRVDLEEMLIRSGLCTPEDFPNHPFGQQPEQPRDISLDAIADELDATDTERSIIRSMLVSVIKGLREAGVPGRSRAHAQRGVGGQPRQAPPKFTEPPEE